MIATVDVENPAELDYIADTCRRRSPSSGGLSHTVTRQRQACEHRAVDRRIRRLRAAGPAGDGTPLSGILFGLPAGLLPGSLLCGNPRKRFPGAAGWDQAVVAWLRDAHRSAMNSYAATYPMRCAAILTVAMRW